MKRPDRWLRRMRRMLIPALLTTTFASGGCLDSDLVKQFRQGYAPGFIEGFSTAFSQAGSAEAGLRRAAAALFEGLGAVIQPRTPPTGSSGSSTRSGSSSSSSSSTRSSGGG